MQLGARYNGIVEVVGSNPIDSTIKSSGSLGFFCLYQLSLVISQTKSINHYRIFNFKKRGGYYEKESCDAYHDISVY